MLPSYYFSIGLVNIVDTIYLTKYITRIDNVFTAILKFIFNLSYTTLSSFNCMQSKYLKSY